MPNKWEDRLVLYVAYLIQQKKRSATVKSYISAIKGILFNGGVCITEEPVLLASLTRACCLSNDTYNNRLTIRNGHSYSQMSWK